MSIAPTPGKHLDVTGGEIAPRPGGGWFAISPVDQPDSDTEFFTPSWWIAAFTAEGALDRTFSSDGRMLFDPRGYGKRSGFADPEALAVQPDGKLIVGGIVNVATSRDSEEFDKEFGGNVDCSCSAVRGAFIVARFKTDGQLDRSFGARGTAMVRGITRSWTENGFMSNLSRILVLENGRIVLAGDTWFYSNGLYVNDDDRSRLLAYGLTSRGRIDRGFGRRGRVFRAIGARDADFFLTDAKVIGSKLTVAGYNMRRAKEVEHPLVAAARLGRGGKLDRTFGDRGWTTYSAHMTARQAPAGVVSADGSTTFIAPRRARASDETEPSPPLGVSLLRFDRTGKPAKGFGFKGRLDLSAALGGGQIVSGPMTVLRDGSIATLTSNFETNVEAAGKDARRVITRVSPAGTIAERSDLAFPAFNETASPSAIAESSSGLVLVGNVRVKDYFRVFLARVSPQA